MGCHGENMNYGAMACKSWGQKVHLKSLIIYSIALLFHFHKKSWEKNENLILFLHYAFLCSRMILMNEMEWKENELAIAF